MVLAIGRKGQVSIEFILIITIALFYITTVVWPIALDSATAAEDVKGISDTKISAMKIANALNEAQSSSGDMKKTISISLPAKAIIEYDNADPNKIKFTAYVDASGGNPDEIKCNPGDTGLPPENVLLNYKCESVIDLITGAGAAFNFSGPIFKNAVVEKTGLVVSVDWST